MKPRFILPWICLALLAPTAVLADKAEQALLWSQYQKVKTDSQHTLTNPVVLQSTQQDDRLRANVYSEVKHSFNNVSRTLSSTADWCEFMPLNLNIKACLYEKKEKQEMITFYAGRKFYQTPDEAEPMQYEFVVEHHAKDYIRVVLRAEEGPYGTRDYNITVQAMPLDASSTLIHVHSAYTTSLWSRMGTGMYLATLGSDKEGFTIEGYDEDRQPRYVQGVKGIIERNTVRYYFSLLARLESMGQPQGHRYKQQLNNWFDMTERYKRQLHELDKDEYITAKHRERENQFLLQRDIVVQ